jgi:hypothetical protein
VFRAEKAGFSREKIISIRRAQTKNPAEAGFGFADLVDQGLKLTTTA